VGALFGFHQIKGGCVAGELKDGKGNGLNFHGGVDPCLCASPTQQRIWAATDFCSKAVVNHSGVPRQG
jgi:hypothetical protein